MIMYLGCNSTKTIPNNGYTAKTFAVAGPRLWNNTLDDELQLCTNVELFKKKTGDNTV